MNDTNDGFFHVSYSDFQSYFSGFTVVHYHSTYLNNYLEVLNDNGTIKYYNITIPQQGPLYIGIEYYNPRLYPYGCRCGGDTLYGEVTLMTPQGTLIANFYTDD
jgi:hypothetical protein